MSPCSSTCHLEFAEKHLFCVQVEPDALAQLGIDPALLTPSRNNGFLTLLQAMRKRARQLVHQPPSFPSLVISAHDAVPQGAFAAAQAQYLQPDPATVQGLVQVGSLLFCQWCTAAGGSSCWQNCKIGLEIVIS